MPKIFRFQCISSREISNKCFCVLKSMLSHYKNRWRIRIFYVSRSKNEENARSRTVTERNQRKIFENYKNFSYNIYVRKINYNKKGVNSMYTKNDIMARLQKGDDPQAIANEIADTLNAALAEYEESKAEAAKKEAAAKKDAEK